MRSTRFNTDWEFRTQTSFFTELIGAAEPWEPVTLPHDATLAQPRDPALKWAD